MKLTPLVDINIAVYNHAPFLRETLDSVLAQRTSFPFRVFIGDDCSTDGSIDILKEYEKNYPDSVEVIYQPRNLGLHSTERNGLILLDRSTAKYIALLDGDDFWTDPLKLQKQIDFLEANEEYCCHCHNARVIQNDQYVRLYNTYTTDQTLTTDDIVTTLSIPTSSVVFRNCLKPMPEYLVKFSLDIIIYFALSRFGLFYRSAEVMSAYRVHGRGSWTGQDTITKMNENLRIKRFYLEEMPLTPKQKDLVIQLVVDTRLNRLKYFSNTAFFGINYFRDLFFLISKRIAGFKFSARFFIFCMLPDAFIHSVKKNGAPRPER